MIVRKNSSNKGQRMTVNGDTLKKSILVALGLMAGALSAASHAASAAKNELAADAQAPVVAITHLDIVRANLELATTLLRGYAASSQQSPGLEKMEILRQINGENHFTLIEVWASQTAYAAHVSSPAVRNFHNRLDGMLGSPHDEQLYREEDRIEAPQ
jgi:quinol monooxygenase YgiN